MNNQITRKDPGIKPFTKTYEELNDRQQAFIDYVAEGYHKETKGQNKLKVGGRMRLEDAYELAGYEGKAKKQAAWRLYMQTKHIIYARRAEMVDLNMDVNLAAETVRDIMSDKDVAPAVRLKAAERILTNQGFDKPQEIILTKKVEDLSKEELEAELEDLLSGRKQANDSGATTRH